MKFENPIVEGKIIKRYKRFLADVELKNGEVITAHTANTGSMKTCWSPGWKVLLSHHNNPKRKLQYGLELTHNGQTWIGVNTARPNKLVAEAIKKGIIEQLSSDSEIRPEVKVGKSRIDLQLIDKNNQACYIEVKNVTLLGENKAALFPDAVTVRGLKHIKELVELKKQGHRAVMFFVVQRRDVDHFRPAWSIDPAYSQALLEAHESGVEVLAYQCQMGHEGIFIDKKIPVFLEPTAVV